MAESRPNISPEKPRNPHGFLEGHGAVCHRERPVRENPSLDRKLWVRSPATLKSNVICTVGEQGTIGHKVIGPCNKRNKWDNICMTDIYSTHITSDRRCACNEYHAMHDRHLNTTADRYISDIQMIREAFSYVWRDYPPCNMTKYTMQKVVDNKTQSKRKLYQQALHSIESSPAISPKDHRADMFVKNERKDGNIKPPRAIQAFSPRYNLLFQTYLLPIEKHFKNMGYSKQLTTKGMDQRKQAHFVKVCSNNFDDPIYILADHNRFDSRQHVGWLQAEMDYTTAYYPGDELFKELYSKQTTVNYGVSKQGTSYTVSGTRMSGVPNTGYGNSIINHAILSYWLNKSNITKYKIIVNGDDSIVIIERVDQHKINYPILDSMGFGTTYNVVDEFHDISYCQTQPIRTINGYVFVRNPIRVISRSNICIDPSITLRTIGDWYHSVGLCEYSLNMGVPVLQSYSKFLMRCGVNEIPLSSDITFRKMPIVGSEQITQESRLDFWRCFGITIQQQYDMEAYYDSKILDLSNLRLMV